MRLLAVTPIHVDEVELARRQARYDRLCPPGVTVELVDLGPDAPTAMDTTEQIEDAERLMQQVVRHAPDGYDALLPDCVLDPAVTALEGDTDRPVLGILRLSLAYGIATGRRCGAVTRNRPIADALQRQVDAYGWGEHFAGVQVLDLDFDAIADDTRWNAALGRAIGELRAAGATWVVNGCSAVDVDDPGTGDVRVVDPVATALALVGAGERS